VQLTFPSTSRGARHYQIINLEVTRMTGNFNKLTPAEAERLALLAEECGELVLAIGKVLRHGYDSRNPHDLTHIDNRYDVATECGDVLAAIQILRDSGDVSSSTVNRSHLEKLDEVWKWMHHAKFKDMFHNISPTNQDPSP
jgi:NTP pyrophosphatase (non-canonical NTP hydrolase)